MQRTLRTNLMLSGLGSWNSPVALVELKLEISPTKISDKKKQEPKLDLRNCNAVEDRLPACPGRDRLAACPTGFFCEAL